MTPINLSRVWRCVAIVLAVTAALPDARLEARDNKDGTSNSDSALGTPAATDPLQPQATPLETPPTKEASNLLVGDWRLDWVIHDGECLAGDKMWATYGEGDLATFFGNNAKPLVPHKEPIHFTRKHNSYFFGRGEYKIDQSEEPWKLISTIPEQSSLFQIDGDRLVIARSWEDRIPSSLARADQVFHLRRVDSERGRYVERIGELAEEVSALRQQERFDEATQVEKVHRALSRELRAIDETPRATVLMEMAAYLRGVGKHAEADLLEKESAEITRDLKRRQQEEEDRPVSPKLEDLPVPTAEELAKEPVEWIVLNNGDVLLVALLQPRPDTLKEIEKERTSLEAERGGTPLQQQKRAQRLKDLKFLNVTLINDRRNEYRLPVSEIKRIISYDELKRMAGPPSQPTESDTLPDEGKTADGNENPLVGQWVLDWLDDKGKLVTDDELIAHLGHEEADSHLRYTISPTVFFYNEHISYTIDKTTTPWTVHFGDGTKAIVKVIGDSLKILFADNDNDDDAAPTSFHTAGTKFTTMGLRRVNSGRKTIVERLEELTHDATRLRTENLFGEADEIELQIAKLVIDLKALDELPRANSLLMMSVHARMAGNHAKADELKKSAEKIINDVRSLRQNSPAGKVEVLVATTALKMWDKLSDSNTRIVKVDMDAVPEGVVRSGDEIQNRRVKVARAAGDWITNSTLTAGEGLDEVIPPGMRVISLPVEHSDTMPALTAGSRVDILLDYKEQDPDTKPQVHKVIRLLDNILVFAVHHRKQSGPTHDISVLVNTEDALKLKVAQDRGTLSVIQRGANDDRPAEHTAFTEVDLLLSATERREHLKKRLQSAEEKFDQTQKQSLETAENHRKTADQVERIAIEQTLAKQISAAFDAQQQIHACRTQLAELDLSEVKDKQHRRGLLKQRIIKRRIEDLLNGGDLQWEPSAKNQQGVRVPDFETPQQLLDFMTVCGREKRFEQYMALFDDDTAREMAGLVMVSASQFQFLNQLLPAIDPAIAADPLVAAQLASIPELTIGRRMQQLMTDSTKDNPSPAAVAAHQSLLQVNSQVLVPDEFKATPDVGDFERQVLTATGILKDPREFCAKMMPLMAELSDDENDQPFANDMNWKVTIDGDTAMAVGEPDGDDRAAVAQSFTMTRTASTWEITQIFSGEMYATMAKGPQVSGGVEAIFGDKEQ